MRTSMLSAWWPRWRNGPWWRWRCQVGTTSSSLEGVQCIRTPNHGIQKTRMKWMRFCMGMDLVMCTSGSWLYFTLIPTYGLQRMRPSCWNFGRRRDVLDSWKMLRAFAFTLSIQPAVPLTQRSHTGWPKRSWVVWPCLTARHMRISWIIIGKISRGSLTFSRVCFTFGGHAEATCEHAGRTNWFHHFRISPISPLIFASISPCPKRRRPFSESGQRHHCIRAWILGMEGELPCLNAKGSCRMKCSKRHFKRQIFCGDEKQWKRCCEQEPGQWNSENNFGGIYFYHNLARKNWHVWDVLMCWQHCHHQQ